MFQNKSYEEINAGIMGKITKSTKPTIIINENADIVVKSTKSTKINCD